MKLIKKTNSYILMTALTMAMAGSSATAQADDHLLKVSSSLMPIHLLTKQIGAGVVDASLILPANQSAHHAPFRPSQRRLITNSDVVFAIDPKMEGTLAKVMVQEADKFVLFSDFNLAVLRFCLFCFMFYVVVYVCTLSLCLYVGAFLSTLIVFDRIHGPLLSPVDFWSSFTCLFSLASQRYH